MDTGTTVGMPPLATGNLASNPFDEPVGGRTGQFDAGAGTTSSTAVTERSGFDGSFPLRVRPVDPPANDDFEEAQALFRRLPRAISVDATMLDGTAQHGERSRFAPQGGSERAGARVRSMPARTQVS